ncbi:unnamed protein product [Kluyveromyces dobzhanskii CBS 2104]|uniref:WGS project CCBQ000000000 data, contig 00058 n=1 Tax=Kluyveromyces dobzhanskii CBS 2104 TaxID=1427455 RepID=A0A0A8LDN9_9SACH|nr:unnamed protein product [Kluyveromyces dobzhanskii CBS 2104]
MIVSLKAPLEIVLNPEYKRKDPSALVIRPLAEENYYERFYGTSATALAARFPSSSFLHLKSLLGKHFEDNLFHYHREHPGLELVNDASRNAIAFKVDDNTTFSVEELVSMNLKQYLDRANQLLKESDDVDSVKSMAIAIPEAFNQEQRSALLDAAYLAGVRQAYLCNDAIAVAIDYASKQRSFPAGETNYYVIYDMGAGSTTASLISISQPENSSLPLSIDFLGYGYTESLSGSVLTLAIVDLLENDFLDSNPEIRTEQFESDASAKVRLVQAAEKAKLVLSANSEAFVSVESLYNDLDFRTTITRARFEEFVAELQSFVMEPIISALEHPLTGQSLKIEELDSVILTGGSTRVPFVKAQLEQSLGTNLISKNVNSDESAVNGAAIRGVQLSKEFKTRPMNIVDRTTHSFGISVQNAENSTIAFTAGSEYPSEISLQLPELSLADVSSLKIDLKEDERVFQVITANLGTKQFSSSLSNCSAPIAYNVTLSLNSDQVFDLERIVAYCTVDDEASAEHADQSGLPDLKLAKYQLPFSADFTCVKPLTSQERKVRADRLYRWDQKDKARLERQRLLNDLEGSLYAARELIEDATDLEHPPTKYIQKLEDMVDEYLESIDHPASVKTKTIKNMKNSLAMMKEKLTLYINHAAEPLGKEEFSDILQKGNTYLEFFTKFQQKHLDELSPLYDNFEIVGLNITEEYYKVQPPKSRTVSYRTINETVDVLHKILTNIEEVIDENGLSGDREDLLQQKLESLALYAEIDLLIKKLRAEHKYRLKLLQSSYERRLAAVKKAEEKVAETQEVEPEQVDPDDTVAEEPKEKFEGAEFEQDEL